MQNYAMQRSYCKIKKHFEFQVNTKGCQTRFGRNNKNKARFIAWAKTFLIMIPFYKFLLIRHNNIWVRARSQDYDKYFLHKLRDPGGLLSIVWSTRRLFTFSELPLFMFHSVERAKKKARKLRTNFHLHH